MVEGLVARGAVEGDAGGEAAVVGVGVTERARRVGEEGPRSLPVPGEVLAGAPHTQAQVPAPQAAPSCRPRQHCCHCCRRRLHHCCHCCRCCCPSQ